MKRGIGGKGIERKEGSEKRGGSERKKAGEERNNEACFKRFSYSIIAIK